MYNICSMKSYMYWPNFMRIYIYQSDLDWKCLAWVHHLVENTYASSYMYNVGLESGLKKKITYTFYGPFLARISNMVQKDHHF